MTIQKLAEKLKKFNVEDRDISWLLDQPTVETAIMMACKERLEVVMTLVDPAAWADYERIRPAVWYNYEGIRNTTRMELLDALERA